jgi:hypothetical protein
MHARTVQSVTMTRRLAATTVATALVAMATVAAAVPIPAEPQREQISRPAAAQAPGAAAAVDHVVILAVDGLRSDALAALPASRLPAFTRLLRGCSTLNARTDADYTITLPNYAAMITGRHSTGSDGHGCVHGDVFDPALTLHGPVGHYVASAFDVAHDHGLHTAMLAAKPKFSIFSVSYNDVNGAPDTVGDNHGRDKLDTFVLSPDDRMLAAGLLLELRRHAAHRSLSLLHLADPDNFGHETGWDLSPDSPYLFAVRRTDAIIGELLDAIESDPSLRARVALIVTSDHGGGVPPISHIVPHEPVNFTIPFIVWRGGDHAGFPGGFTGDLYRLNAATRGDPGTRHPHAELPGLPPIRNGDAANLALALLGLPPVPGSTINAAQDLRLPGATVTADAPPPGSAPQRPALPTGANAYD